MKEAEEALANAKKHLHDLNTSSTYENVNSNNTHSHKSQPKKKKPRTMTEAEEESMNIMRDTTHNFTSTLPPETILDIEKQQATLDLTHDDDDDDLDCSQD